MTHSSHAQETSTDYANAGTPILEAVGLRKYFPVRGGKLFAPRPVVHAVEETSGP